MENFKFKERKRLADNKVKCTYLSAHMCKLTTTLLTIHSVQFNFKLSSNIILFCLKIQFIKEYLLVDCFLV